MLYVVNIFYIFIIKTDSIGVYWFQIVCL